MKKYVPSLLTASNLICGFLAILIKDPIVSPLLILCGAFFDIFDGMVARWLKAASEFGKQLDSLADLVTFGVAPAYLYYHYILPESYYSIALATLIPLFSAIRLAIFNIDASQSVSFRGLPTPANAIFFLSFPLLKELKCSDWFSYIIDNQFVIYAIPIVFSFLLVSPIRMFSFKSMAKGFKKNPIPFIFLALILCLVYFVTWMIIPLSIGLYIVLSIFENLTKENKVNSNENTRSG